MSDKRTGTPEPLWGALRQYFHNDGSEGFVTAFDYDEILKIFEAQAAEIERLEAKVLTQKETAEYIHDVVIDDAETVEDCRTATFEYWDSLSIPKGDT